MPTFMDYHQKLPPMPPEAFDQVRANLGAKKADEFGVTALDLYAGKEGQAYCLTDAPDADAVVKSHQAQGVPQTRGNVVEVTSLAKATATGLLTDPSTTVRSGLGSNPCLSAIARPGGALPGPSPGRLPV